jgi:Mg-chelatase subunit ChlD
MRYLNFTTSVSSVSGSAGMAAECLIVVLDVSPSMEERDWPPSRLAAAQDATEALIARKRSLAPNDRVGIVAYDDAGHIVAKPTQLDDGHRTLISALRQVQTGSGTDIGAGLLAAGRLFFKHGVQGFFRRLFLPVGTEAPLARRIVLLSDGHHNGSRNPRRIAKLFKRHGVIIDCVGIGGAPSDVDESLLKSLATVDPENGLPRYAFIGDKANLIERFKVLAGRVTR